MTMNLIWYYQKVAHPRQNVFTEEYADKLKLNLWFSEKHK